MCVEMVAWRGARAHEMGGKVTAVRVHQVKTQSGASAQMTQEKSLGSRPGSMKLVVLPALPSPQEEACPDRCKILHLESTTKSFKTDTLNGTEQAENDASAIVPQTQRWAGCHCGTCDERPSFRSAPSVPRLRTSGAFVATGLQVTIWG